MIADEKQILRSLMRTRLAGGNVEENRDRSKRLRTHLFQTPAYARARVVYGFSPLASEPDWSGGELPADKIWGFPRMRVIPALGGPLSTLEFLRVRSFAELEPRRWGLCEPPDDAEVAPPPDLIFVPGLAFDAQGGRLGRGKGFYDAALGRLPGFRLGICFDSQRVPLVPTAPHDQRVQAILTESGLWEVPAMTSLAGRPARSSAAM